MVWLVCQALMKMKNMDRLTELAAKGVFGSVEAVFTNEVAGFVPLLFEMQTRPLTEQDQITTM